jgi:hypothetical protein
MALQVVMDSAVPITDLSVPTVQLRSLTVVTSVALPPPLPLHLTPLLLLLYLLLEPPDSEPALCLVRPLPLQLHLVPPPRLHTLQPRLSPQSHPFLLHPLLSEVVLHLLVLVHGPLGVMVQVLRLFSVQRVQRLLPDLELSQDFRVVLVLLALAQLHLHLFLALRRLQVVLELLLLAAYSVLAHNHQHQSLEDPVPVALVLPPLVDSVVLYQLPLLVASAVLYQLRPLVDSVVLPVTLKDLPQGLVPLLASLPPLRLPEVQFHHRLPPVLVEALYRHHLPPPEATVMICNTN